MGKMTMVEAINMAHAWEMAQDPSVVVLGEDVGTNGGVFRATAGLQQRFGRARVQDTPLAEGLIAGAAIGMAAQGLKPVAEIQFMGFIYPALDQIASHMARLRNRTRGRLTCPLVLRMPHGGGIHAPEHHSESLEALLCHHPGLRVVCPSSPARAYGLGIRVTGTDAWSWDAPFSYTAQPPHGYTVACFPLGASDCGNGSQSGTREPHWCNRRRLSHHSKRRSPRGPEPWNLTASCFASTGPSQASP